MIVKDDLINDGNRQLRTKFREMWQESVKYNPFWKLPGKYSDHGSLEWAAAWESMFVLTSQILQEDE